jgi:hypothetical protein
MDLYKFPELNYSPEQPQGFGNPPEFHGYWEAQGYSYVAMDQFCHDTFAGNAPPGYLQPVAVEEAIAARTALGKDPAADALEQSARDGFWGQDVARLDAIAHKKLAAQQIRDRMQHLFEWGGKTYQCSPPARSEIMAMVMATSLNLRTDGELWRSYKSGPSGEDEMFPLANADIPAFAKAARDRVRLVLEAYWAICDAIQGMANPIAILDYDVAQGWPPEINVPGAA